MEGLPPITPASAKKAGYVSGRRGGGYRITGMSGLVAPAFMSFRYES